MAKSIYFSYFGRYLSGAAALLLLPAFFGSDTVGQVWNSSAGGYNGGYGLIYRSLGEAAATKNMQDMLDRTIQQSILRQSAAGRTSTRSSAASRAQQPRPATSKRNGVFRPVAGIDTGNRIADCLGGSNEERELIRNVYTETKRSFEAEAAKLGWKNNLSGALAFFTGTAVAAYNGGEEISEAGLTALFEALDTTLNESETAGKMPDREKQEMYNRLIGFGGLLMLGFSYGLESGDSDVIESYRKLAGEMIRLVLKTDPDSLAVESGFITVR